MARKRTRKPKLPRLLDNSPNPIAVVDNDFEIIYANEACCNWLGVEPDALVGTVLSYGIAADSTAEDKAAGICPDPNWFADGFSVAQSYIQSRRVRPFVWKKAVFQAVQPIEATQHTIMITAIGDDLHEIESDPTNALQLELTKTISQLRQHDLDGYSLDHLIGSSDFAKQLKRKIKAIAENHSDCLVVGLPGTGRQHVARSIFAKRNHPTANLVPVHCAIADSELIQESIKEWVFNQRKSQSTDWLLLLDVDKMQPDAQNELFGYTQLPNFPIRILATSEYDLLDRARQNEFHFGLAMHLSVQVIQLPPLAKRKNDLDLITQFFIQQENQNVENQISGVSTDVQELFYEYAWPGNLDELRQCIKEAHQQCGTSMIQKSDLPDWFRHSLTAARIGYHEVESIELEKFLADIESQIIKRALERADYNKTKAAQLLGINRAKLLRRAEALQIIQKSATENQIDSSAFKEADS